MGWFLLPYQSLCLLPTCGRFWSYAVVCPGFLSLGNAFSVHEGLFKHSTLGTALCLLKWGNHTSNFPSLHIASSDWVCMFWQPPALAGKLMTVGWGVDLNLVWEGRPLPQEPPLHVPWGLPSKIPSPKRRISWPGHIRQGLHGPHNWYQILYLPHQGIYLLLLIPELFGQLILFGGGILWLLLP